MVALSPSFAVLATLCTLAALSSAPISDAVVLPLRASDLASTEMASNHARSGAAPFFSRRSSHVVSDAPILPLPKGLGGSPKSSDDSPSDSPSGGDSDSHGEKVDEDSTHDGSSAASTTGGKSKAKDRRWNLFSPMKLLSASWFGDNRVHYARAPHHHHHHHHHHDRRHRGLRTRRDELGPDRDISSFAITPGGGDNVHVGRSPHHHHHHHSGYKKVIVSGDHDHVRVGHSRREHHHHHHHHHHQSEHEKVIVSGDHDHVRVDRSLDRYQGGNAIISGDNDHVHRRRSVFITGEQGQSYVVPRVAKRSSAQELFAMPPLKKRAGGMDCAPGYIHIMSPSESGGEFLASLVLASTNSTSSDNSANSSPEFILNASEMDMTPMCLQASSYDTSDSGLTSDEVGVTLLVEMFDATSASIVPYCATFDPDPPAPAPLTAEKCTDNPVGGHLSQLFAFNRATGVVRPMWFKAQDDGTDSENKGCIKGDDQVASSLPSAAEEDGDSTPDADQADQALIRDSAVLAADSPETAPSDSEGSIPGAQNVALVFVAMDPVVVDTPGDSGASLTSASATATGAETNSSASTPTVPSTSVMSTASPTTQVAVSSSGSVSAPATSSAGPATSVSAVVSSSSPTSVPSSTGLASGAHATPSMMLGVQVVPESASDDASSTESATPTVTPMNTQPYEWMFTLDS